MLEHGGRLRSAAARYHIALEHWLDLSTGINPYAWPVPTIPADSWSQLPDDEDGLLQVAKHHYGCEHLLSVNGSQQAIQCLPRLRSPGRVGMLAPCYAEHPHAWQQHGHQLVALPADNIDARLDDLDVLLLVNPNNPTGQHFDRATLLDWHARLARRGGWLVVDEAFIDATPHDSLAADSHLPGLIVLRSLGKFFGLAGARVGFVLAEPTLLEALAELVGPWPVAGPARHVARLALADQNWRTQTCIQLTQAAQRLHLLLSHHGLTPNGHCALFCWHRNEQASQIHNALAHQGILTRLFEEPASLRFGLPGDEKQWQRLERALEGMSC